MAITVSGEDQSYVETADISVFFFPELNGNILIIEHWTYNFTIPHSQVFRTIPAGYSSNRKTNNDGIGNIFVLNNDSVPYKELPPSLFTHTPNTFEVFEDAQNIHIFAYFPPTIGQHKVTFSYEVAGCIEWTMHPLLYRGKPQTDYMYWPAISSNNPLPVHNVTAKFLSRWNDNKLQPLHPYSPLQAAIFMKGMKTNQIVETNNDQSYETKVYWENGSPPLPAYRESVLVIKIARAGMGKYLVMPQWQRVVLFERFTQIVVGFLLIAFTVLPLLVSIYYRSPIYSVYASGNSAVQPEVPSDLFSVSVLIDGYRKVNPRVLNIQMVQWISDNVVVVKSNKIALAKDFEQKCKNQKISLDFLRILFRNYDTEEFNANLTFDEYEERVKVLQQKLIDFSLRDLQHHELLWKSPKNMRREFSFICLLQFICLGMVYGFGNMQRAIKYWISLDEFYWLFGGVTLCYLVLAYFMSTMTSKGSFIRACWKYYIAQIPRSSQISEGSESRALYDAAQWGKGKISKTEYANWIRNTNLPSGSEKICSQLLKEFL